MAMQSSSHSWSKGITKALGRPSKMRSFSAWMLRVPDNGMFPVFVSFIVALLGDYTIGQFWVSFISIRTN